MSHNYEFMNPKHVEDVLKLAGFESEETPYSEQASGWSSSPSRPGVSRQEQVCKQGMEFYRPWNSNLEVMERSVEVATKDLAVEYG
ncbi:hypothetical protein CEXT_418611 [Caerostris extrusa]|uniref:Uncharacterized protein n=1 Tax=Caerostris extrusa TaxID=172846 RepID=A0AAV4NXX1_CAEEX|nr:hypothetical protein CEXT_418611 [Caerostris extrusa]